ncbi:uncharacterized protein LOC114353343 isoform X2 [Ostrinia furnacalis]|uniref:uncharacterized protein LOC114353343 isoform X2 n=1 Tax=Ostrinia furnacalis TaxID=93504 RepID=UPI00103CF453|nr:uncharacterized protein LOC114353343 isoform X2 [Ostrinia furnacalis]
MPRAALLCFVWLFISPSVLCSDCVSFNFENDFETQFDPGKGICGDNAFLVPWTLANYSSIAVESPHPLSESFITPAISMSCVASSTFPMSVDGVIEINLYMDNEPMVKQLIIVIQELNDNGNYGTINTVVYSSMDASFIPGWASLRIDVDHATEDQFDGHIVLMGMASAGSVVLVDSFRYIPSSTNEEDCEIYTERTTLAPTTITESETDSDSEEDAENGPSTPGVTDSDSEEDADIGPSTSGVTDSDSEEDAENGPSTPGVTDSDSEEDAENGPSTPGVTDSDSEEDAENGPSTPGVTDSDSEEDADIGPSTPGVTDSDSEEDAENGPSTPGVTDSDNGGEGDGVTGSTTPVTDFDGEGDGNSSTTPLWTNTVDEDFTGTVTETWSTAGDNTTEDVTTADPTDESSSNNPGFWNPFTITMVAIISATVLFLLCLVFYQLGKLAARRRSSPVIVQEIDYDNLPRSMTVPRARVYTDVGMNPFRNSILAV